MSAEGESQAMIKKQFWLFTASVAMLTLIFVFVFHPADLQSLDIFIPLPFIISIVIIFFFLFSLEKAVKAEKDENKTMRKNWQLGFFGGEGTVLENAGISFLVSLSFAF